MTPQEKTVIDYINKRLKDMPPINNTHAIVLTEEERQALIKLTANTVDVGGELYVDAEHYDFIVKDGPKEEKEFRQYMMDEMAYKLGKTMLNSDCIRFSFLRKDRCECPSHYIVRASATIIRPSET